MSNSKINSKIILFSAITLMIGICIGAVIGYSVKDSQMQGYAGGRLIYDENWGFFPSFAPVGSYMTQKIEGEIIPESEYVKGGNLRVETTKGLIVVDKTENIELHIEGYGYLINYKVRLQAVETGNQDVAIYVGNRQVLKETIRII
mgnify:CR=1 FL=1